MRLHTPGGIDTAMREAIIQVENRDNAASQLAQTTLRSVLGQHALDDMLAARDKLNAGIQRILDPFLKRREDKG